PPRISTLSLHDALPIWAADPNRMMRSGRAAATTRLMMSFNTRGATDRRTGRLIAVPDRPTDFLDWGWRCNVGFLLVAHRLTRIGDRKSTRLNSSHLVIS